MRQKDEMERTENARARSNRHILWLTYGIAALFIAMAVYFGWFIQFKSENVIGSSYNARLDLLSDRVTRGSIMSNDKTVLAQTNVASDGSEKRYYPYDYLFVHSVGSKLWSCTDYGKWTPCIQKRKWLQGRRLGLESHAWYNYHPSSI